MRNINRRSWVLALVLCTLALCSGNPQNAKGQESSLSVRQRFSVVPAYRRCEPAEVKFVSMGHQPKEAILAQVTIENRSDKVIAAVKLGWRVYGDKEGMIISTSSCTAPAPSANNVPRGKPARLFTMTNHRCLGADTIAASEILESPQAESTSLPLPRPVCESDARPARSRQAVVPQRRGSRCAVCSWQR